MGARMFSEDSGDQTVRWTVQACGQKGRGVRLALATLAGLALSGCASLDPRWNFQDWDLSEAGTVYVLADPDADPQEAVSSFDGARSTYLTVVEVPGGWCYIRTIGGTAHDQICQLGSRIRYSPEAPLAVNNTLTVPRAILGLFDALDDMPVHEGRLPRVLPVNPALPEGGEPVALEPQTAAMAPNRSGGSPYVWPGLTSYRRL